MFVPNIAENSFRNSKGKRNIYNFTNKVRAFTDNDDEIINGYSDYSRIFINKINNALNNFVKMSS